MCDTYVRALEAVMGALPLDSLVMLTVQDETLMGSLDKQFWHCHPPMWPLLRSLLLAYAERGIREIPLEDNEGCESPVLPSLTVLALASTPL